MLPVGYTLGHWLFALFCGLRKLCWKVLYQRLVCCGNGRKRERVGNTAFPPIPSSWPGIVSKAFPSTSTLSDYHDLGILLEIRGGLIFFSGGHRVYRWSHTADRVNTGVIYPDSRINSDGLRMEDQVRHVGLEARETTVPSFTLSSESVPNSERPVCANFLPVIKRRPAAPPKTSVPQIFTMQFRSGLHPFIFYTNY